MAKGCISGVLASDEEREKAEAKEYDYVVKEMAAVQQFKPLRASLLSASAGGLDRASAALAANAPPDVVGRLLPWTGELGQDGGLDSVGSAVIADTSASGGRGGGCGSGHGGGGGGESALCNGNEKPAADDAAKLRRWGGDCAD